MKKLLLIFIAAVMLAGCQKKVIAYDQPQGNVSDVSYFDIADEHFYDITFDEVLSLIEEKKTFITVIGHEGCKWCEELFPILDEICSEKEMNVYYLDTLSDDNTAQYDAGSYDKLAELCADFTTRDEGEVVIWAPSIIYVQLGKVINVHEGTVNTHNANERKMTEREITRLRYNLGREFDSLLVKE